MTSTPADSNPSINLGSPQNTIPSVVTGQSFIRGASRLIRVKSADFKNSDVFAKGYLKSFFSRILKLTVRAGMTSPVETRVITELLPRASKFFPSNRELSDIVGKFNTLGY